jgi:predicted choloylglycine hydrolase
MGAAAADAWEKIASAQTITLADKNGDIAVVECNPIKVIVIKPEQGRHFVAAANNFKSAQMEEYRNPGIDDWHHN